MAVVWWWLQWRAMVAERLNKQQGGLEKASNKTPISANRPAVDSKKMEQLDVKMESSAFLIKNAGAY
ncbi:MAG: hypothetical protein ACK41V_09295 [Acidovorax sp.]|uniref:hypothetical protein n=1 Tax=Acidovorax sp. TaxID=1872122 RepID=UPI00391920D6